MAVITAIPSFNMSLRSISSTGPDQVTLLTEPHVERGAYKVLVRW